MRMSIRRKTIGLAVLTVLLTLIPMGVLLCKYNQVDNVMDVHITPAMDTAEAVRKAEVGFKSMVQEWKDILLRGKDPEKRAKHHRQFLEKTEEVKKWVREIAAKEDGVIQQEANAFLVGYEALLMDYAAAFQAFEATHGVDAGKADQMVAGKDRPVFAHLDKVVEMVMSEPRVAIKALNDDINFTWVWLPFALLAAYALIGWLEMLYLRGIITPLAGTVEVIEHISQGDLTKTVPVKNQDEIGRLGEAVNRMVEDLRGVLGRIQGNATHLTENSHALSAVSTQLASSTMQMSQQTSSVAQATGEMTDNIHTMASAVEQMNHNIHTISAGAEQMSQTMNTVSSAVEEVTASFGDIAQAAQEASRIANQAASMSHSASQTMSQLGTSAKSIGQVTSVIKHIADQTNLLALNATIEAASAGDAGRGFAVVANEIKQLASQSANAADDITSQINDIQQKTQQAVKVIAEVTDIISTINKTVEAINRAVDQQSLAANHIANNVLQAAQGSAEIAVSISELAKGANEVSKNTAHAADGVEHVAQNIQGVNQAVRDNASGIDRVHFSAQELANMAKELQTLITHFDI